MIKIDSGYLEITTVAADGVNIITGNLKVGNGSPTATPDGDDLYVTDNVEIDGTLVVEETVTITGAVTLAGDLTVSTDTGGGNAGTRSEIIGLPKLRMVSYASMSRVFGSGELEPA